MLRRFPSQPPFPPANRPSASPRSARPPRTFGHEGREQGKIKQKKGGEVRGHSSLRFGRARSTLETNQMSPNWSVRGE